MGLVSGRALGQDAKEDHALEQCLDKAGLANSRNSVNEVGTRLMAEQKGARMKAVRSNQAQAERHK